MGMTTNTSFLTSLPRVFGQYEIEAQIGRGGSSRVFRAHHRLIRDQKVALKVLLSQDAKHVQRFEQEASIAARLRHPHISRLINYGVQNPFHYAVFEYIPGQSLRDLPKLSQLDQRQKVATGYYLPLPSEKVLRYFRQIADALDYAHSLNLVHRDLSPGNILIDAENEKAYLIDFGIARDPDQSLTSTDIIMGTPGFVAPECMLSAQQATRSSDIFSLGVVLFYMLTGEEPWRERPKPGNPYPEPVPIRTLAEVNIRLPDGVDRIIRTLMAWEPENRYASAGAAAADLEIVLGQHFVSTQVVAGQATAASATVTPRMAAPIIEPNEVEQALSGSLFHEPLERALARARALTANEIARLLDEWAQARPFRLPLLGRLARLHNVRHSNVFFFHLQLLIEQRRDAGIEEEPDTQNKQLPPHRELDRWQIELPPPTEFSAHPGGRVVVPNSEQIVNCPSCNGQGVVICSMCQGNRRVTVAEPDPPPSDTTAVSADNRNAAVTRQRLVACPQCKGRGQIPCTRCASSGRLVQRKLIEWSRQPARRESHNDLPDVDESWLRRTCKAELVYQRRVIGRLPSEWLQITEVKTMIEAQQQALNQDMRIVMAELRIHVIPLTEIEFDLGQQEQIYRLAIYGFENLIPPDWRFLHWERILWLAATGILTTVLLICLSLLTV